MFEFEKKVGDLTGYSLVLPAVSVGNVGEWPPGSFRTPAWGEDAEYPLVPGLQGIDRGVKCNHNDFLMINLYRLQDNVVK
jgi:hypothetical protein